LGNYRPSKIDPALLPDWIKTKIAMLAPPDVQGGDVPVADALLPPRMGGDSLDGQIDFDKAFGQCVVRHN